MFKSVQARFALRATLFGVAATNASLLASITGSSLTWNEAAFAFLTGVSTGLAYAGIGAAVPQVEPNVGNKLDKEDK